MDFALKQFPLEFLPRGEDKRIVRVDATFPSFQFLRHTWEPTQLALSKKLKMRSVSGGNYFCSSDHFTDCFVFETLHEITQKTPGK